MTDKKDFGLPSLEEVMRRATQSGQKDVKPSLDKKVVGEKPSEPAYSTKYKKRLLYVQLTEKNNFHDECDSFMEVLLLGFPTRNYNNREVEVTNQETKETVYLNTGTKRTYGESYPGVCEKILPGGNYTVKSTINGETVSRNITVDGDIKLLLQFKRK